MSAYQRRQNNTKFKFVCFVMWHSVINSYSHDISLHSLEIYRFNLSSIWLYMVKHQFVIIVTMPHYHHIIQQLQEKDAQDVYQYSLHQRQLNKHT